jgi:hypothetical protein
MENERRIPIMFNPRERRKYHRAEVKWPVIVKHSQKPLESVAINASAAGAFIRCGKPIKPKEIVEIVINIRSNIYGPDDNITPHGMGVQFKNI